jgi:mono/diheme cytochrome c family protein
LALLVPAVLALLGVTALAESPPPPASPQAPPSTAAGPQGGEQQPPGQAAGQGAGAQIGDPKAGQQVYQSNCTSCHGANLEGGVGQKLNPIEGGSKNLAPDYLINTITNGRSGDVGQMPAWKGKLSDQQIKDVAAYIIEENKSKSGTLSPRELAISNVQWVSIGILVMLILTYLLARYNMRWVERRARRG